MAEKERLRLRQTFAELLSPSAVSQTARGTLTVHDEPVVGGSVKGDAGQDGSSTEGPADGSADDDMFLNPKNAPSLSVASESSAASPHPAEHLNGGGTRTQTGGLTAAPAALQDPAGQRERTGDDGKIPIDRPAPKPPTRLNPAASPDALVGRTHQDGLYQDKLLHELMLKNSPMLLRRYVERKIIEFIMATQEVDSQLVMIQNVAKRQPRQFSAARHRVARQ